MADRIRSAGSELRCGEVGLVDPAGLGPVQVEKARARLAEVARDGRQERARANDVAAGSLALEALSEPQQRRALAVELARPPRSGGPGRPSQPRPMPACSRRAAVPARPSRPCARRRSQRRRARRGRSRVGGQRPGRRRCPGTAGDGDRPLRPSGFAQGRPRLPGPAIPAASGRVRAAPKPTDSRPRRECRRSRGQSVDRIRPGRCRTRTRARRGRPCCRSCPGRPRLRPAGGRTAAERSRRGARRCPCSGRSGPCAFRRSPRYDVAARRSPRAHRPRRRARSSRRPSRRCGEAGALVAPRDRGTSRCSRSSTCGRACRGSPHALDRPGPGGSPRHA